MKSRVPGKQTEAYRQTVVAYSSKRFACIYYAIWEGGNKPHSNRLTLSRCVSESRGVGHGHVHKVLLSKQPCSILPLTLKRLNSAND